MSLQAAIQRTLGRRTRQTQKDLTKAGEMSGEEQALVAGMPGQGAFGQNYASSLNSASQDALFGGMFRGALALEADKEAEGVAAAQAAQLRNAIEAERIKNEGAENVAYLNNVGKDFTAGLFSGIHSRMGGDPVQQMVADSFFYQGKGADIRKTNADATKANFDAGIRTPTALVDQQNMLPTDDPSKVMPTQNFDPRGITAGQMIDEQKNIRDNQTNITEAGIKAAGDVEAAKAANAGDVTIKYDEFGRPQFTFKVEGSNPAAVQSFMAQSGFVPPVQQFPLPANKKAELTRKYRNLNGGLLDATAGADGQATLTFRNGTTFKEPLQ